MTSALLTVSGFSFGPFVLVSDRALLLKDGLAVKIGANSLKLLRLLVENAPNVLSTKELLEHLWPGGEVDGSALRVQITALRKTLEDRDRVFKFIATVPQRGYSFAAGISRATILLPEDPKQTADAGHYLPNNGNFVIGRDDVIGTLAARLLDKRLLSIVGHGGIGKTTVALSVAENILHQYPDGLRFIDLSPLDDADLVSPTLASSLGLAVRAESSLPALGRFLRTKNILIVLDSCEHLIESVAALCEFIHRECPDVGFLCTSREPLRLRGEVVHQLESLAVPPIADTYAALELMAYSSVQMLVERCTAKGHNFALTEQNAASVAMLCRRLEGIPLALELASTHLVSLGISGLQNLLADGGQGLSAPASDGPARHQTLDRLLDWSYTLLDQHERNHLQRLSVFRGWFSIEASDSIAGRSSLEVVEQLAAKSMIVADLYEDHLQYRLLDTTRSYAWKKLAASEEMHQIRDRHVHHCLALSKEVQGQWELLPEEVWTRYYNRRVDDVRTALEWAFARPDMAGYGVKLTIESQILFYQMSMMDEYHRHVKRALAHLRDFPDRESEIVLLTALAHLLMHTAGITEEMDRSFARAYQLALESGLQEQIAETTGGMWISRIVQADFIGVTAYAEKFGALPMCRTDELMDIVHRRMSSSGLHLMGQHAPAIELARDVIEFPPTSARAVYNSALLADRQVCMRSNLSRCLWIQGRADEAIRIATEAVELGCYKNSVSLCMALAFGACPVAFWAGDMELAHKWVQLLKNQSARFNLAYWHAWACSYELILNDDGSLIGPTLEATVLWPLQRDNVLPLSTLIISEADVEKALSGAVLWSAPELMRRKAVALLSIESEAETDRAVDLLRRSLALANAQGALAWELRTAISMAEWPFALANAADSAALLSNVYGRFTEGFQTADLRRARRILEQSAYRQPSLAAH